MLLHQYSYVSDSASSILVKKKVEKTWAASTIVKSRQEPTWNLKKQLMRLSLRNSPSKSRSRSELAKVSTSAAKRSVGYLNAVERSASA
jgi:hypothetical protein